MYKVNEYLNDELYGTHITTSNYKTACDKLQAMLSATLICNLIAEKNVTFDENDNCIIIKDKSKEIKIIIEEVKEVK